MSGVQPALERKPSNNSSDLKPDDFQADVQIDELDDSSSIQEKRRRKAERRFLLKLDLFLITWAWLAYLIKLIDSSNYKTAYVSGMKEKMNMYGNELNIMDTTYRVGYALFLIPSQVILTKIRPSIWLPSLELAWGLCTGLMAAMPNVNGMYAMRFFIGVFEASSYPGIICVLCSWYTPKELAMRVAIFGTSYPASQMFVSSMQTALYKTMNGTGGLLGYQWLFIFNAIMTAFVAVGGYFCVPDDPVNTRVWWLNAAEQDIAKDRMTRIHRVAPTTLSWVGVKKILSTYVIWVFGAAYCFWSWSQNSNTWIGLFLKSYVKPNGTKFSVAEINSIPLGGFALQILAMLFFAWISDRTGSRLTWILVMQTTLAIGLIILSIWPPSFVVKMVGFYLLWMSNAVGPLLVAWMSSLCPSPEERSIVVGISVTMTYVGDAFLNILIYPASKAPNYPGGYKVALGFCVACMGFSVLLWFKSRGEISRIEEEAKKDQEPVEKNLSV